MLVALSINEEAEHQRQHGDAMAKGFQRHGLATIRVERDQVVEDADIHVTWSVRRPQIMKWHERTGRSVLIMERGHVGDRVNYASCGWNGLGRRASYAQIDDHGERWRTLFSGLLKPWRGSGSYALLIGQLEGDSALAMLPMGFPLWAQQQTDALRALGYSVLYRPHPRSGEVGQAHLAPRSSLLSHSTLAKDLANADLCVTFNSTTGVDAVLAGIPTITLDQGAMAWTVATHELRESLIFPDRGSWAHQLAWTGYTLEEIQSGFAWEHVCEAMPKEVTA